MAVQPFQESDLPDIHKLLTTNHWDFYLDPVIDERGIAIRDVSYFFGITNVTLVSRNDDGDLEGFIHFDNVKDSNETSPSFNINVDINARGKGIGTQLLKEGITYVLQQYPNIRRIYATTREDNIPTQNLFKALG